MSSPKRIQRRRTKGWRMPEGAIYVGRPSRWGNHWVVAQIDGHWVCYRETDGKGDDRTFLSRTEAQQKAIDHFREDLLWDFSRFANYRDDYIRELRGHDLACWCPLDSPCHGDILLEVANS